MKIPAIWRNVQALTWIIKWVKCVYPFGMRVKHDANFAKWSRFHGWKSAISKHSHIHNKRLRQCQMSHTKIRLLMSIPSNLHRFTFCVTYSVRQMPFASTFILKISWNRSVVTMFSLHNLHVNKIAHWLWNHWIFHWISFHHKINYSTTWEVYIRFGFGFDVKRAASIRENYRARQSINKTTI